MCKHPSWIRESTGFRTCARGVPITDICAHVGHANKALTLDT